MSKAKNMQIKHTTALVLGAAKGIGKAIAAALARQGARVVVTYYDWPEASDLMKHEFDETGFDFLPIRADLRDPDQVASIFDKIRSHYGGLDILVNNIERGGMPVVHGEYIPEQWDIVAKMARIPPKSVSASDRDLLKYLERDLKLVIFGQDKAISVLGSAIKMAR